MTQTLTRRLAVPFAALAVAGMIGGVTALSLVGGSEQPAQQQPVTVSDEATETPAVEPTPTAEATSASPTATAAPVTTKPAVKSTTKSATSGTKSTTTDKKTNSGSKTVSDQTEPTDEATGTSDIKPDPAPLPSHRRCTDDHGVEIPCPSQD